MDEINKELAKLKLVQDSRINDVFTPHSPVKKHINLVGRADLAVSLIKNIVKPGSHSLLYGDRGVGKSSLANAVIDMILQQIYSGEIIRLSCDSTDTFESIVVEPLRMAGVNLDLSQTSRGVETSRVISAEVKSPVGGGGASAGQKNQASETYTHNTNALSPSWVGNKIKGLSCLIVIDEFDAIVNDEDKSKVAEMLKYLSDNSDTVNVVLVGIGKNASDLTAGHPSVGRCLSELHVGRMAETELRKIVTDGAEKVGLVFDIDIVNKIVKISAGYPYFTHLIALHCAEQAVINGRRFITFDHLHQALIQAVESSKSSIGADYFKAIRGGKSAEYKRVLLAAAKCDGSEFTVGELSAKLSEMLNVSVTPDSFTRFLQNNTSTNCHGLFRRVRTGIYQFIDPRMPSFIFMENQQF